jgi:hypothetical protein
MLPPKFIAHGSVADENITKMDIGNKRMRRCAADPDIESHFDIREAALAVSSSHLGISFAHRRDANQHDIMLSDSSKRVIVVVPQGFSVEAIGVLVPVLVKESLHSICLEAQSAEDDDFEIEARGRPQGLRRVPSALVRPIKDMVITRLDGSAAVQIDSRVAALSLLFTGRVHRYKPKATQRQRM